MGVPPLDVDHWAADQVRGCLHWLAACTRSHGNTSYVVGMPLCCVSLTPPLLSPIVLQM